MLIVASIAAANERRRTVDVHGQEYLLREFVGAVPRRGTYVEGNEVNDDGFPQGFLVTRPPEIEGGYLKVPAEPGWGTELDEDAIRPHPPPHPHRV